MTAPIFHRSLVQGSPEWFEKHIGVVTAGSFARFMTSDFELRKGDMLKSYLHEKIAEKWRGQLQQAGGSFLMEQGLILEEEAIPWFELEYDCEVKRMGFIESADRRSGCSPDGMISDSHGIELKCPAAKTHVGYLLAGVIPVDYRCQVYGSMFVSGATDWTFCSYRRGFPALILPVKRNEEIMDKIGAALSTFHEMFAAALERIQSLDK